MLINDKMTTIVGILTWHFNIYEQDKFRAQLSMEKFYNLRAW